MLYFRTGVALAVIMGAILALPCSRALAYGSADQPLAQLEFSGNCDNPSFPLCANVVGVGGIWIWAEVDADYSADFAGSVCVHGQGGAGGTGATPLSGTGVWHYSTGVPAGVHPTGRDPGNRYYIVVLNPEISLAFPVTQGHYSSHPAPGVALEATVAP